MYHFCTQPLATLCGKNPGSVKLNTTAPKPQKPQSVLSYIVSFWTHFCLDLNSLCTEKGGVSVRRPSKTACR